jgi:hypothetical protein
MACTQPGCTGTIIDGYCDACGSPANAAPFVAAESAASAESPNPADGPGPTAVRPESGVRPETKNEDLNMGCTQPGCIGTIVDCYCNVCGSPADASPFVTAEAAASATTPGPVDEPGLTAVLAPTPAPAAVEEEMPTQLISRVSVPSEQLSAQEVVEPRVADAAALGAQKVDGDKEVAEYQPNGAQEYRTRVEEAQLPHDVREAALWEVGKLEQTSDDGSESGDIRTWLDTILDLPWSGKTTDWIDIQESRDVEATLRRLIEPAADDVGEGDTAEVGLVAADVQEADTAEIEPVAADIEEADTAEVEPVAADVEEADTPDIEPVAAEIEKADTAADDENAVAEVGSAAVDIEEADTAEVAPVAADIEEADTAADSEEADTAADVENAVAEVGPAAVDIEEADTAEIEPVAADIEKAEPAADVETAVPEIGPAAAGVEQANTAGVEPVAADLDKADTAPIGPQHDDTVKMLAVPAASSGGRLQRPQLPEQQVLAPEPVQTPAKKRRFGYLALAAAALAALLIGALLFAVGRDRGVTAQSVPNVTATASATVNKPTNTPSHQSTGTGGQGPTIQLENLPESAKPFEIVRIEGRYRNGPDTFVQVQRWEGGEWVASPIPAKTDESGKFTTFVELGPPGRYRLRVVDPDSGVTSKTFVLVIKG